MEIKIENLKKIYGQNTVIDIPELTLHQGELIGSRVHVILLP